MSISISGSTITYSVPAFTVLHYTELFYNSDNELYHTLTTFIDGGESGKSGSKNVEVPHHGHVEIQGDYEDPYTPIEITVSSSPGGVITHTGSKQGGYYAYDPYYNYIQAKEYYSWDPSTWKYDTEEVSPLNSCGISWSDNPPYIEISSNSRNNSLSTNVVLHFKKATSYVYLSCSSGGSVTGSGRYDVGSSFTITATPEDGWHFVRWEADGDDFYDIDRSTSPTITKVAKGRYLWNEWMWTETQLSARAVFERNTYNCRVTLTPQDSRLNISGYISQPKDELHPKETESINSISDFPINKVLRYGSEIGIFVNSGTSIESEYKGIQWSDEDTITKFGYYKYITIQGATIVSGTLVKNYKVNVDVPDGGGCVYSIISTDRCNVRQSHYIKEGNSIKLLARADECYKFLKWTGVPSAQEKTNGIYVEVNSDMNITAVFEKCPDDGRLIHCKGDIIFDTSSGNPMYQPCDCS